MKRYLLFMMNDVRMAGGWDDFVDDFDTLDEAMDYATTYYESHPEYTAGHVVDTETKEIIESWSPDE